MYLCPDTYSYNVSDPGPDTLDTYRACRRATHWVATALQGAVALRTHGADPSVPDAPVAEQLIVPRRLGVRFECSSRCLACLEDLVPPN